MRSMTYHIFTDGSCFPNPGGSGGWSYVVYDKTWNPIKEDSGFSPSTTNNRMELVGVIEAVKYVRSLGIRMNAAIYCDSEYVVKGCNVWLKSWLKKKKLDLQDLGASSVKNPDLGAQLVNVTEVASINWVRGHSGNVGNERADYLAESARLEGDR